MLLIPRRAARPVLVAAVASAALLLSACSASSGGAGGPTTSAAASGGSAALAARLAKDESAATAYDTPTTPISDLASVKGKTVFFIPITQQAPQFAVTEASLKTALSRVGVGLQTCDGGANPTSIAACVTRATAAKAGAIVTDAVQYQLAANQFDAAQEAGIPVLNTDLLPDAAHPASKDLEYISATTSAAFVAIADWITVDSGGTGVVVVNESTDNPASGVFVQAGVKELKAQCPRCTVHINDVSSASFNLIASSTSSALLKAPDATYVISEYDQYLQPTQAGVQQAGRASTITGISGATSLTGLQMLKSRNFLSAAVGQSVAYLGWLDADAALRMMTGTSGADLPTYTIPWRLFTRDDIGGIDVTAAAQSSGEWFGPTDYPDAFLKAWGVR